MRPCVSDRKGGALAGTVALCLSAVLAAGPSYAGNFDYEPPGSRYSSTKSRHEDSRNLTNTLFIRTHIPSTVKKDLRGNTATLMPTDGPAVVNGVNIGGNTRILGDVNILIQIDGETVVLTE